MVEPVYFPKPEIVYPGSIIKDVLKITSRVAEEGLQGPANTELFKLEVTLENVSKKTVKWFELEFEAGTLVQTWDADAEEKEGGTVVRLWPEAVAKEGIPPGVCGAMNLKWSEVTRLRGDGAANYDCFSIAHQRNGEPPSGSGIRGMMQFMKTMGGGCS